MKFLTLLFAVLLSTSDLLAQLRPPAIPPTSADALKFLGKPTRSVNIDAMVANVLKNPNPAARTNLINFIRRTLTNPADLKKFDAAIAAAIGPARVAQPAPAAPQPSPATANLTPQQPEAATSSGTAKPQAARPTATVRAHDIPDLLKEYSELLDRKRYTSHDDASAVLASRGSSDGEVAALKMLLQNKTRLAQEESATREKLKLAAKHSGFSEALLDLYGDRYRQAIAMEDLVRQQDPQGLPIARKAFSEAEKDLQNHPLFVQLQKQEQSFSALSNALIEQQRSGQELTTSQLDQLQQAAENAFAARKKLSALMGTPPPQPESIRNEAGGLLANRRLKAEASPAGSRVASSNSRPVDNASPISPSPAQPTPTAAAPRSEPINRPHPTAPAGIETRPKPTIEPQPVAQPQPATPAPMQFPQSYPVAAFSAAQAEQLQTLGQQYGFPPYQMLRHPYANTAGLQYMFELAQYVRTAPDYSALTKAVDSLPQEHKESLGPILDSLRNDQPAVTNPASATEPQPTVQPATVASTQSQPAARPVANLPPDYPTSVLTAAQQEQLAALGQQYGFPPYAMLHHPFAATTTLEYVFQLAKYVRDAVDESAIGLALQNVPPEYHESFGALLQSTRPQAAREAEAPPQEYGYEQNNPYAANAEATEPGFADQPPQEYDGYDREPTEPATDYVMEGSHPPEEPFPSEETSPTQDYDVADEPPVDSEEALEQLEYGTRSITAGRPTISQPTTPTEWNDPVFNRLVDITLLARGIQEINSEFLTSAALQFLNAEQALQKSHKAITAEDLFRRAVDVALNSNDTESLERLSAAAKASGRTEISAIVDAATQLNAGSRTMTSATVISLKDLNADDFDRLKSLQQSVRRVKLIGHLTDVEELRQQIEDITLPKTARQKLIEQLGDPIEDSDAADALKLLANVSRRHMTLPIYIDDIEGYAMDRDEYNFLRNYVGLINLRQITLDQVLQSLEQRRAEKAATANPQPPMMIVSPVQVYGGTVSTPVTPQPQLQLP